MYEVVLSKTIERRGQLRAETLLRVRVDAINLHTIRQSLNDFTLEFIIFIDTDGIEFMVRRSRVDSISAVTLA